MATGELGVSKADPIYGREYGVMKRFYEMKVFFCFKNVAA